jgi:hypothetical protein
LKNKRGPPFAFVEFDDPRWDLKGCCWIDQMRGRVEMIVHCCPIQAAKLMSIRSD